MMWYLLFVFNNIEESLWLDKCCINNCMEQRHFSRQDRQYLVPARIWLNTSGNIKTSKWHTTQRWINIIQTVWVTIIQESSHVKRQYNSRYLLMIFMLVSSSVRRIQLCCRQRGRVCHVRSGDGRSGDWRQTSWRTAEDRWWWSVADDMTQGKKGVGGGGDGGRLLLFAFQMFVYLD